MKAKYLLCNMSAPCSKCPYTLGQVRTPVNPCPQCKANGYRSYELFKAGQFPGGEKTKGEFDGTR